MTTPTDLPALVFISTGPDGTPVHYRVDKAAPDSSRDRELLRALLRITHTLLNDADAGAEPMDRRTS